MQARFLSTLSLRRATQSRKISPRSLMLFLSTLSLRRATPKQLTPKPEYRHFYPRSPCGERLMVSMRSRDFSIISIHALLAESDNVPATLLDQPLPFLSTLSLRRATACAVVVYQVAGQFLSTLSLRRATGRKTAPVGAHCNFYPRSPCGERRIYGIYKDAGISDFYPRSPCGERLISVARYNAIAENFYPRSPCGERPGKDIQHRPAVRISIHALLAESDLAQGSIDTDAMRFLSTLSLRRATILHNSALYICPFLSTLSLRRATCVLVWALSRLTNFYPRSPCGERLDG